MQTPTKPIPQLTPQQQVNFWKKVDRNGPTMPHMDAPCWVWTACKNKLGYGQFGIGSGRVFLAHRVAFVLAGGSLDGERNNACHTCDNPACCRFSHLFAGSHSDNAQDKEIKGRGNHATGERHWSRARPEKLARGKRNGKYTKPENTPLGETHGMSKLTSEQVIEIRSRYSSGGITQTKIAKEYNVTQTAIWNIIQRKTWTHV